jgi:hypothetical protein
MMGRTAICAGLLALASCLTTALPRARAQVDAETGHDPIELQQRLQALDTYLDDIEQPSRRHYATWLTLLSAACATQVTLLALADDARTRTNFAVGAGLSAAGVLAVILQPHPGRYASRRYRALPSATFAQKREKVRRGEAWLEEEANSARFMRSWLPQVGAVAVGLGAGLGLGYAFEDNWLAGLRVGLGALIVTQVRVWSRPDRSIDYLERYQSAPTTRPLFAFGPWLHERSAGASVRGTF